MIGSPRPASERGARSRFVQLILEVFAVGQLEDQTVLDGRVYTLGATVVLLVIAVTPCIADLAADLAEYGG